jgi:hypothetical protein
MALPPIRTLPAFHFEDPQLQILMMGIRDAIYDLQGINKRSLVQSLPGGRQNSLEPDDRLLSTTDLQAGGVIKAEIDTTVTDKYFSRYNAVTNISLGSSGVYNVASSEAGSILIVTNTGTDSYVIVNNTGTVGDVVTVVNATSWVFPAVPSHISLQVNNSLPGSKVVSLDSTTGYELVDPLMYPNYSVVNLIYIQADPCIWLAALYEYY